VAKKEDAELRVFKNAFDIALKNAEDIVNPGMFKGPNITELDSWVSIPSDPTLEERLRRSLQRRWHERVPESQWLTPELYKINTVFMTSCFGVLQRDNGDFGFFLLPYISIRPPFYLLYSGIFTRNFNDHREWHSFVEPCPGEFIKLLHKEKDNFFRFLKHRSEGLHEFIISEDYPGLVKLVKTLRSSADLLELHCLKNRNTDNQFALPLAYDLVPTEPSSSQPIPEPQISGSLLNSHHPVSSQKIQRRVPVLDYIDFSGKQCSKICKDINENGYSCVEFLPLFRETARSMLGDASIHDLAKLALKWSDKIRDTRDRHYFIHGKLFSSHSPDHLFCNFVDGPLKQACMQLVECIDGGSIHKRHSLIWKEGTIGLLSGPKEKEQRPHMDCAPQLNEDETCCPRDSESTLTVVGMCEKFFCFNDCLLCRIVVFQSIVQMMIRTLLFGRTVLSRFD
jgi:hypothetical protein